MAINNGDKVKYTPRNNAPVIYTEDNIGDEVSIRYPHGTLVDTIVVENTCVVCGQSYIGIKEEVAHLLAQHSIIHGNEAEQILMSIAHLDDGERMQLFKSHITGMEHIFEAHPPMRNKVLVALQICLSRFASIQLVNGDDQ